MVSKNLLDTPYNSKWSILKSPLTAALITGNIAEPYRQQIIKFCDKQLHTTLTSNG